jgi:hypothetical protein
VYQRVSQLPRLRLTGPRSLASGLFKASTAMLISESIPQLIEMDAINIPSVLCFHVPAVPKKMLMKALWYVDHQATHVMICKTKDKEAPFEYFILKKDHKTGCKKITEKLVSMYLKALTNEDDDRLKDVEHFEAIYFSLHWVCASSTEWGVPECDLNPVQLPALQGVQAIRHLFACAGHQPHPHGDQPASRAHGDSGKKTMKKKKGGEAAEPALTQVPQADPDSSDDELMELLEQGAQGK